MLFYVLICVCCMRKERKNQRKKQNIYTYIHILTDSQLRTHTKLEDPKKTPRRLIKKRGKSKLNNLPRLLGVS